MPQKKIKFTLKGALISSDQDRRNNLLLRIFEKVGNIQLEYVTNLADADFVLAYPYGSGKFYFKLKWIVISILQRFLVSRDSTALLRWLLGVGSKPTLFVSHENLDRPYWWKAYGKLLSASNLSRITFWPKSIDPKGVRFPYWYNYLQWAAYPRESFYSRYGRLYEIEVLMAPLKNNLDRQNKAVCITSHLDYPRLSLLEDIQLRLPVDIYGNAGISFAGDKYSLMKQYRYAFCPENSVGFGYDTEKIPEAWMAGCIPICQYLNPFSDFNPEILKLSKCLNELPENIPLLLKAPTLTEIEDYVKEFIHQNNIGYANLQRSTSFFRWIRLN